MAKFHLMHCTSHPKIHGLHGYKEVIESVQWGLSALGHEVSYALNTYDQSATNIIFGAQVLPIDILKQFSGDTIIYNLEQNRGYQKDDFKPAVLFYAANFQIWEYSAYNFDSWDIMGAQNPKLVPIGYAPILTRIPKPTEQDIDIFIYGMTGEKRVNVFHELSLAGFKILYACGLYGESRDALIARSKIILNVNLHDSNIFEVVRVSYLLANKKAVVSTYDKNTAIEKDIYNSIRFIPLTNIIDTCTQLIDNETERTGLESVGYELFIKRNITDILSSVLP